MAIDEIYEINSMHESETAQLKKALTNVHQQAVGTRYTDTEPVDVPVGKLDIWDDGTTRRLYVRTGKGSIGYVTLTIV